MASIEQFVYGCKRNGPERSGILARSTAIADECADEVAALCERWAEPVVTGAGLPALLSLPLESRLEALRGPLFLVARTLPAPVEAPALCHGLVLNEAGYAGFGLNPYLLALEGPFHDCWGTSEASRLRRLELKPSSLAPLVSPLPGEQDSEPVGEALRQLLAARKVLLPLAGPRDWSDRFLALLLAGLPLPRKRSLRFASFASLDTLDLGLAALAGQGRAADDWRRILLAADPVAPGAEDLAHVAEVQQCLRRGDLAGLEQLGRRGSVRALPPRPLAASVENRTAAVPRRRRAIAPGFVMPAAAVREVAGRGRTAGPARALRPAGGPGRLSPERGRDRGSERPPASRTWGVLLVLALLAVATLWAVVALPRLGGAPARERRPAALWRAGGLELSDPLEVGLLYRTGLARREVPRGFEGPLPMDPRTRARTAFGPAADALKGKARRLLRDAAQDLAWPADAGRERDRLLLQGAKLLSCEAEARRLVLYHYALAAEAPPWPDLPDLGAGALSARWDSLALRDARHLREAAAELGLGGLPAALLAARHRLEGLHRLAALWSEPRIRPGWLGDMARAAVAPGASGSAPATTAWRESAQGLVELARAEAGAAARSPALATPYLDGSWRPAPLQAARAAVRSLAESHGPERLPALFSATVSWLAIEDGLAAAAAAGEAGTCARLLDEAEGNLAFHFAPGDRPDHLDRLRLEAVRVMVARGDDPLLIPVALYPGGDREATLEFLAAAAHGGPELRELAIRSPVPFLARLAGRRSESGGACLAGQTPPSD